ncbi:hypothetical protein KCP76_17510 [Salmonella enterica subsp. enterica serovar Weltevreden]|nr:hypothetical protein KCP76_17510 [Salmonella enterica subsp. enterica serovar Weltevreden]
MPTNEFPDCLMALRAYQAYERIQAGRKVLPPPGITQQRIFRHGVLARLRCAAISPYCVKYAAAAVHLLNPA